MKRLVPFGALLLAASCSREPPVAPPVVASSAPSASASSAPSAPTSVARAPEAATDPCVASFAKRLAAAQEAIEDATKERARGKERCALLKKKCTPRPGGTAAVCAGTSQEDHDFFEDTCLRWSGVRWYDGSYTYFGPGSVRRDCPNDPAALTIEESTWDDDVARLRGTRP